MKTKIVSIMFTICACNIRCMNNEKTPLMPRQQQSLYPTTATSFALTVQQAVYSETDARNIETALQKKQEQEEKQRQQREREKEQEKLREESSKQRATLLDHAKFALSTNQTYFNRFRATALQKYQESITTNIPVDEDTLNKTCVHKNIQDDMLVAFFKLAVDKKEPLTTDEEEDFNASCRHHLKIAKVHSIAKLEAQINKLQNNEDNDRIGWLCCLPSTCILSGCIGIIEGYSSTSKDNEKKALLAQIDVLEQQKIK